MFSYEISILLEGEYPNYSPEYVPRIKSIATPVTSVAMNIRVMVRSESGKM
jgi:hypothetical protein